MIKQTFIDLGTGKMLVLTVVLILFYPRVSWSVLYESYSGEPLSRVQAKRFEEQNITQYCTNNIEPCDGSEWKRLDGSCNNLNYPQRGAKYTPTLRILPPEYHQNNEPAKAKSGRDKPLARYIHNELLTTGKVSQMDLTQLLTHFLVFGLPEVNTANNVLYSFSKITHCCTSRAKSDRRCTPIVIPEDDPVHRYSKIRCMNQTRPDSFQTYGCLNENTTFERLNSATPVFDLDHVYGSSDTIDKIRTYSKGMLIVEIVNGKLRPPSEEDPDRSRCFQNVPPNEQRCHKFMPNSVLGANLFQIIFYRQHNALATALAEMNPCWNDERLFYTARDINIAIYCQIYFYEMLPLLFGKSNLEKDGLYEKFKDTYDPKEEPKITLEHIYVMRWFHTIQEDTLKLYDKKGNYVKSYPLVNTTFRTGFLDIDDHIDQVFQGSFRQPCGGFDQTVDFDMANRLHGSLQHTADVAAFDLNKGRYFGFQSYVKYREFCSKLPIKHWDDLLNVMTTEKIYRLKSVYDHLADVELLAGIWLENYIEGGRVPHTLYCLMVEQLKRTIRTDRHWYERPNRPHAFTIAQIKAIRSITLARVMCNHADSIIEITLQPFKSISWTNPIVSCEDPRIEMFDIKAWKDPECE